MTTLARINGEALSVPGLRFWGYKNPTFKGRFSIFAQDGRGAVELWSEPHSPEAAAILGDDSMGGVEIHSPKQLYDFADEPTSTNCHALGGNCWADGSSLAYIERFVPLIKAGDSAGVLRLLADWHQSHFGGHA